jgi:hypothetical protein
MQVNKGDAGRLDSKVGKELSKTEKIISVGEAL